MKFVFLHVGDDIRPKLLVKSIRKISPDAEIIQCTNSIEYKVPGIDRLFVEDGDISNLMTYRLQVFSNLRLDSPAIYLDTDILLIRKPNIKNMLEDKEIAVCRRSFSNEAPINTSFRGMNLSEYDGKTLGQVYPYLASFNITRTHRFWDECKNYLSTIDKKFHYWYGDQEAIRDVLKKEKYSFRDLSESTVSCLPEYLSTYTNPIAIHFKGRARKELMIDHAKRLGII
jgi:hypothetical protein